MELTEQPLSETSVPPAPSTAPALPPLLLALGRGFTLAGWAAVVLVNGIYGALVGWGVGPLLGFLLQALAGFLFVFLFEGAAVLLWKLLNFLLPRLRLARANAYVQAVPPAMLGRLIGILLMVFGDLLWPESVFKYATLAAPGKIIVLAAAFAGAVYVGARQARRPAVRWAGALAAIALVASVALWLLLPGTDDYLAQAAPLATDVRPLDLENPGLPGPFAVGSLSYGSGESKHRPEFGERAALITPVVDGSPIFAGYSGFPGSYFKWYNGFDFTRLPLNGLVWYPEGEGPFPLVLIVHGNHDMTEPSDPGYAYLGEHLASRGYIAVSVDQNFLNGFGLADGNMAEMPLRSWLLLKHLEQWREWNATPGNPFYGQVDLERIALIGHSRGGEAVAHAAEMNDRPVDAAANLSPQGGFGFGIRGVVALAPSDNRYKPRGRPLLLNNVDYLLLASGHDGDMYYLDGLGQYNRATFDNNPDGFKALAYLYRGNHGNFNTVWGDADQGAFESLLLNRKPLLTDEEQQAAAKVFITSFLEASLNGRDEYRALFYNTDAAADWLPDGATVTQYLDARFIPVATHTRGSREALDVSGGRAAATGVTDWRSAPHELRDGKTTVPNRGLLVKWDAGSAPDYTLTLPEAAVATWALTPEHALSFVLTNMLDEGTPGPVVVELADAAGEVARLPLDRFGPLQPALPARLTKAAWVADMPGYKIATARPAERVGQTYDLPLADFVAANTAFNPAQLAKIRFLFDATAAGQIVVDEVGFRRP